MDKPEINNLKFSYDKDADVLYVSKGSPVESICEMIDNGVVVRKNPETKEIVGFTIIDFLSHFSKVCPISIPIEADFHYA